MLVHFIGGPAHGRSEAIQTVPPIIKMPEAVEVRRIYSGTDKMPLLEPTLETLEYRVTRQTRRYAIAEFVAPRLAAHVEVNIQVSLYDSEALHALTHWTLGRREAIDQPGPVKLVGVLAEYTGRYTLQFQTLVDGPADAAAAAEAGEAVQNYLDSYLPAAVRQKLAITQTGVSVDD